MSSGTPIWARPEPGSRRPRYSREQIAEVAVRLADADGFEAVSMRRVAAELDASPMSLYHYLQSKDDLVALMDDALMGEALVPPDSLPEDWREGMVVLARRTRDVFLRHPWALAALHGGRATPATAIAPQSLAHFEQSLGVLENAPLGAAAKFDLLAAVDDFVTGHALRVGEIRMRRAIPPEDAVAAVAYGEQILRSGRYPHLEAIARDPEAAAVQASILDERHAEDQFDRGLGLLLDGWATQG
jgi:AcrR family transcriptional regulator